MLKSKNGASGASQGAAESLSPLSVFGRIAWAGNRLLDVVIIVLLVGLLAIGGYSLWYSYYINHNGFLSDKLKAYKPEGENALLNLRELMELNPDVIGWLTVEGTHIDYPVLQGKDDTEYLNKDALGDFSLSGSLFLSSTNARDFSDSYSIIYGHHMENGAMLGDLEHFTEYNYFVQHPTGVLTTPDGVYTVEFFASIEADAYDSIIYRSADEITDVVQYADELLQIAAQQRDPGVGEGDRLLALSTCTDATTFGRIVLIGRLMKME